MICHFSVILLCVSGVYCISSTIKKLDSNGLKRILNSKTTIGEWDAAMDQNIIQKDANDLQASVNVRKVVDEFKQQANNNDVTEFESTRDIIETAYQCTLRKYASLTAFLILRDLWQLKSNITTAIRQMIEDTSDFDVRTMFGDKRFQKVLSRLTWEKLHLDFDYKFVSDNFQLITSHDFVLKTSKEIYNVWADMIQKKFGLKIKYKIYTDVMSTKFTNEFAVPLIDTINELVCVLNEAIQLLDNFIVDNCVPHGGRFVENFESLIAGFNGNFMWLLKQLDKMKTIGTNLGLYRDFTKSVPETLPAIAAIKASGCFVESLEFEISGLKTNLASTKKPTEIYGHDFNPRISEINMKLIESIKSQQRDGLKIGMLLFRDEANLFNVHPQFSEPVSENMILLRHEGNDRPQPRRPTSIDTKDLCLIN
ncbi:uncharacterized protein LOC126843515 isoform X2 [Adelges cooleyi]|uniref:uncharacterized protein LOC126843515 isoform X2 n=2 Tax=Adelges cooleyi TaxID=133065 RepID=UPI00218013A3|nr:uncharacterized protein LOC126843515 isoform X2 [Adelges cooleyi]